MEKLTALVLAIILATAATAITESTETKVPVVTVDEKEEPIVVKDLSEYEKNYISIYDIQGIREYIKGEYVKCDCSPWATLCHCTSLYHILEDKTKDDFYSVFFNRDYSIYSLGRVYSDCSSSMQETFCYEKSKIIKSLLPFLNEEGRNVETIFKNQKTDLYGFLHSLDRQISGELIITAPTKEVPIIITDLWDTEENEVEPFRYWGEVIFCVPYASTNKEGVLHCEEVVNDLLWNYSLMPGGMPIYVVYTDEVITKYSNGYNNGRQGYIEIYVP